MPTLELLWWETLCQSRPLPPSAEGRSERFVSIDGGAPAAAGLIIARNLPSQGERILNVSYDPTRELYQSLNGLFAADFEQRTGRHLTILQSHGGSSRQARAVISGDEPADV